MGTLPQVLEIIFEVQRKMSNEKITRKKISFSNLQNIFFVFILDPTFKPHNFLFLIHFIWFKVLQEYHLKFYKSTLNFNNNKTTYKEFGVCLGTNLCSIWWFFFFEFLSPSTLNGHNFLNSIPFFTIFNALNMLIGGVQVLFKHKKQWNPSLGSGLLWTFKCYHCNSITTNE